MINNRMRGLAAGIALAVSVGAFTQAYAERFEGFGQDIPLESAARQIVPGDVKVDYGPGVDSKIGITFSSAADWQSALSLALSKKGLKAEIGKDQVTIVKAPKNDAARAYSSSPSKSNVQQKNNSRNPHSGARANAGPRAVVDAQSATAPTIAPSVTTQGGGGFSIRQASAPAPIPAAAAAPENKPVPSISATGNGLSGKEFAPKDTRKPISNDVGSGKFIVVPGYDLRVTLESWAASTGWTVNWQSEFKYQIEADATFHGDFVKAVSDLVKAMSDARPTITVDFYSANRVVVISNTLADEVN